MQPCSTLTGYQTSLQPTWPSQNMLSKRLRVRMGIKEMHLSGLIRLPSSFLVFLIGAIYSGDFSDLSWGAPLVSQVVLPSVETELTLHGLVA